MAQRTDDPSITDDDLLWRRIPDRPEWWYKNGNGDLCLSSVAFLDRRNERGEVSVHLARLTTQERALKDKPDVGLVEITARVPRSVEHIVTIDPTNEDESHSLICPKETLSKSGRKASAKKMAEAAHWILLPLSLRR